MKNYTYFLPIGLLAAFLFVSCSVEEINETNFDAEQSLSSKSEDNGKKANTKIEICHYNEGNNSYNRISISINALNGHANHAKDIIDFDNDKDGFPCYNECEINFREDGLWDLDDNDPSIQDEVVTLHDDTDCFSHIVGQYSASQKYQADVSAPAILYKLNFTVSKEDQYFIEHISLMQKNEFDDEDSWVHVVDLTNEELDIKNVNEMPSGDYSFQFSGGATISDGSGYYICNAIAIIIKIEGSDIPPFTLGFYALKDN